MEPACRQAIMKVKIEPMLKANSLNQLCQKK